MACNILMRRPPARLIGRLPLLAVFLAARVASGQQDPASHPPDQPDAIVIHNATVIDGTGAPPRMNADVVIRDGPIAGIEDARSFAHPRGARVIDATGKYLIPGLIDMHAHVAGDVITENGEPGDRWERDLALSSCARSCSSA